MDIVTVILTLILVLIPNLYYIKWRKIARVVNKLPGPRYVPFIGTVYTVRGPVENRVDLQKKMNDKYGPLYRTWIGSIPMVNLLKAEHAEVLFKDARNITKGQVQKCILPWLGNSVACCTGDMWHLKRKLLTPAFHFKILEDFSKIFVEKAEILIKKLEEQNKTEDYIDIFLPIKLCGLDIICKTAMGIELNAMDNSNRKYVKYTELISELTIQRLLTPWLHYDFIFKRSTLGKKYYEVLSYLHEFTNKVLHEKKKLKTEVKTPRDDLGTKKRLAFLDLVLEASDNGKLLTDEDIKNEVNTFMFAGHDTTTVATCWCLFLLGNHPEIQNKVYEELQSIFHDEDRPINMSDIKDLKYLEMCIKDALRLYPSAPFIIRYITHPITIDKYEIPAGSNIQVHIYQIHRDPNHYPEPDRFNPDNFLPENCSKRHPFAFIPFSAGLRNCIGQKFAYLEEKIILATILRKFKVTSLIKPEEMKVFHSLILRPQDGIKIKLEQRDSKQST